MIVGFPGETRADVAELERFLTAARLDAIGVFDYSDEDGTEAAGLDGKVSAATIARRYARVSALAEELCNQRAEDRVGSRSTCWSSRWHADGVEGRAAHQAPEVDGSDHADRWRSTVAGGRPGPGAGDRHRRGRPRRRTAVDPRPTLRRP